MFLTVHDDIFPQIGTGRLSYDPSLYPPATNPVFKAEVSVSGGYTDISTIENWPLYGGETQLDAEGIKDEIDTLVVAKTFASCTDEEKDVDSEWFVVDKSDRDTRHTAAQQESNAEILIRNIHMQAPEKKVISLRDSIKNESAANIKIIISNIEISSICFSDQEIAVDTASRTILSSTTTTFVSLAGTGPDDEAGLSFQIPDDYVSGGELAFYWSMDGTNANQGRIAMNITHSTGADSEVHSNTDETLEFLENGYSGTAWRVLKSAYKTLATSIAAGDYIHIQIQRDPGHTDDVLADTMYITTLMFRYTSNK